MKRRSIFQALVGLIGAKSLPAAPVKVPASLQVAKAAASASPSFTTASIVAQMGESIDKQKWYAAIKERQSNPYHSQIKVNFIHKIRVS